MQKITVAFFGSPKFASEFLEKIISDKNIPLAVKVVVTQPDKPIGRNRIIAPSPVKQTALKYNVPVLDDITKLNDVITSYDFAIVFAYGNILPEHILGKTRIKFGDSGSGFINIHFSLLPLYRGAAPTAYSLALGDKKTGVSFCVMNEKMDQGPILASKETTVLPAETRGELDTRLTDISFGLLKKLFAKPLETITLKQQLGIPTYAPLLKKQDGYIPLSVLQKALKNEALKFDELPKIISEYIKKYNTIENWELKIGNSSKIVYNYFRGLSPWPGIWTLIQPAGLQKNQQKKRLKIIDMTYDTDHINITRVQLEGKNGVDFNTFQKAYGIF